MKKYTFVAHFTRFTRFMSNITVNVLSPSAPASFIVQWDTFYPSMWNIVTYMCRKAPIKVVKSTTFHESVLLYDCAPQTQQYFILRNEDLDIYNRCEVDLHGHPPTNLHCDYFMAKNENNTLYMYA